MQAQYHITQQHGPIPTAAANTSLSPAFATLAMNQGGMGGGSQLMPLQQHPVSGKIAAVALSKSSLQCNVLVGSHEGTSGLAHQLSASSGHTSVLSPNSSQQLQQQPHSPMHMQNVAGNCHLSMGGSAADVQRPLASTTPQQQPLQSSQMMPQARETSPMLQQQQQLQNTCMPSQPLTGQQAYPAPSPMNQAAMQAQLRASQVCSAGYLAPQHR